MSATITPRPPPVAAPTSLPPAERPSIAGPLIALLVALFAFLPIANWIPGGHAAPWYRDVASGWVSGTAIAVGVGVVLAILSGRWEGLWRDGLTRGAVTTFARRPWLVTSLVALMAMLAYVFVALRVLGGRPLLIDELVQVLQAQMYAHGSLWTPVAPHPEFFSSMHVVDTHGKVFSQFPAGGPAVLTLGVLLGAPWIVGPLCGAIAVMAFGALARRAEPTRPAVALGALLLFAFAPFAVWMSGSHMNHVPALMWVTIAIACGAQGLEDSRPRPLSALASGLALGCAAATRPVDALAFALPLAVWYLARALGDRRRWADAFAAGAGVAIPMALLIWANLQTTGAPLLFGYEQLWGANHGLGFHRAPWGLVHTPARGVELVNLYLLRLQTYLFETPFPSLLPAIAALGLARRFRALDRYLLWSGALLLGLYFAYWHDGFYLGPRFVYLLLPVLALYSARSLPALRERVGSGIPYRATVYGLFCSAVIALVALIPFRADQYRSGMLTMRWNADSAASAAGVHDALVLVRESWGAQLVARMWALGVPRSETEMLYRNVDACLLERHITTLESGAARNRGAWLTLQPLLADSARTISSPISPDSTEKVLPGSNYTPRCVARVQADRQGFTLLTPLLLAHGGGNVYARDLHERDTLLLAEHPTRPLWLLRPATSKVGAEPRFYRLSRDSVLAAWRGAPP